MNKEEIMQQIKKDIISATRVKPMTLDEKRRVYTLSTINCLNQIHGEEVFVEGDQPGEIKTAKNMERILMEVWLGE